MIASYDFCVRGCVFSIYKYNKQRGKKQICGPKWLKHQALKEIKRSARKYKSCIWLGMKERQIKGERETEGNTWLFIFCVLCSGYHIQWLRYSLPSFFASNYGICIKMLLSHRSMEYFNIFIGGCQLLNVDMHQFRFLCEQSNRIKRCGPIS